MSEPKRSGDSPQLALERVALPARASWADLPFAAMQIGESFLIDAARLAGKDLDAVARIVRVLANRHRIRVTCRHRNQGGGLRVERIA